MTVQIANSDIIKWSEGYKGEKFHASLGDWPYELNFMEKGWDASGISFQVETWRAITEHLHPGAFVLAFGGSRTYHRLAVAAEDAGLIIHPAIVWLQAQGFPKATRIDTQIDEAAGVEQNLVGTKAQEGAKFGGVQKAIDNMGFNDPERTEFDLTEPVTKLAQAWAGHRYGLQALKPCAEFILVAQKPYEGKPVESIVSTGAGALWIDGGRVATGEEQLSSERLLEKSGQYHKSGWKNTSTNGVCPDDGFKQGRWPPNVCLTHAEGCVRVGTRRVGKGDRSHLVRSRDGFKISGSKDNVQAADAPDNYGEETVEAWECVEGCPVAELGEQSGERKTGSIKPHKQNLGDVPFQALVSESTIGEFVGDTGTATRFYPNFDWEYEKFFFTPKVSSSERNLGLSEFYWVRDEAAIIGFRRVTKNEWDKVDERERAVGNIHPTQKPIALAKWLATLILPPSLYSPRRLLIPFSGTGSETIGGLLAGWDEITTVEQEKDYCALQEARVALWDKWVELGHDEVEEVLKAAGASDKALKPKEGYTDTKLF